MSLEDNKAIVRRYQAALNANDLDALDAVVAADIKTPDMLPGFASGLEGAKQIHRFTVDVWEGYSVVIDDMLAEGDRVAARITITGKAVKPAFGLPGNGNSFTISGMYIVRIAGGKIVEHRGIEDAVSLMQQVVGNQAM